MGGPVKHPISHYEPFLPAKVQLLPVSNQLPPFMIHLSWHSRRKAPGRNG